MANSRQASLPGFDMRQMCPLCGCTTRVLGQYSPLWPWGVCRGCSLSEPYPCEIFEEDANTKDRSGLRIKIDADYDLKAKRVDLDNVLKDAIKPRKGEWSFPYKLNITLRELRNPVRYGRAKQYRQWHIEAKRYVDAQQYQIPLCHRCGQAHEHKHFITYADFCPRCEAEISVEALWTHRGIFGTDDAETALDRMYKAQRKLFDMGVLPDYWFELKSR